jgi:hypothetical protein
MTREVLKLALESLDNSIDTVWNEYLADWRHGLPTRKLQLDAKLKMAEAHEKAINSIKAALVQPDPVLAEREACALICDKWAKTAEARLIRARSQA